MADRKPPREPAKRSLAEQLRALPKPALAPPRPPPPPPRPVLPEGPSFRALAGEIQPVHDRGKVAVNLVNARPAEPEVKARRPAKARLWVEQKPDHVRAREASVPAKLLADLEAGRIVPRRDIDLHRLSAAAAREALDVAVKQAQRDRIGCVRIVCGRGLHSGADGPVLPELAVERLSQELSSEVLAFATAPRKWGGSGALLVVLRARVAAPEG